ncbi:hypothetical protein V2J09_021991 [Rumex salicifolius]
MVIKTEAEEEATPTEAKAARLSPRHQIPGRRFNQAVQPLPPRSFQAHNTSYSQWYPDTAATHHFTPVMSNLRIFDRPYEGTNQVVLGDGSTIPINSHRKG